MILKTRNAVVNTGDAFGKSFFTVFESLLKLITCNTCQTFQKTLQTVKTFFLKKENGFVGIEVMMLTILYSELSLAVKVPMEGFIELDD